MFETRLVTSVHELDRKANNLDRKKKRLASRTEACFKKCPRGTMASCEAVAAEFNVTAKTVPDIWRGRTWGEATGHLQSDYESRWIPQSQQSTAKCNAEAS